MSYTSATVEGYVIHEPVLRKTKTDKSVCVFSLMIKHYTHSESEAKVSFIDIEAWDGLADMCVRELTKKKRVMVIGSLKQDRWEKDGKQMSKIKLVANKIRFIDSKPHSDSAPEEYKVVI